MSAKFVIRWKSKVNGRAGRGTKEFRKDEGERLIAELNEEYPDIEHELIAAPPPAAQPEPPASSEESDSEKQTTAAHASS